MILHSEIRAGACGWASSKISRVLLNMSFLELKHVSLGFGPQSDRTQVLHDVNLSVRENEFVAIIGFSGSGKSTLMSLLAGLYQPDSGQVLLRGKPGGAPGPDRGILFQNYSLLPWLTVYGNIELAVRQVFPRDSAADRRVRIQKYIDMVSLTNSEWKKPPELSGGMRQRLALARTLAMQPEVLLLDEPLSALDALTRANLQDEIVRIRNQDRRTIVMITNDVDEAVLMADRIIALTPGPRATLGRSFDVNLDHPRDRTTLNFNSDFRTLRNEVTRYLLDLNQESQRLRVSRPIDLPDLAALDLTAA